MKYTTFDEIKDKIQSKFDFLISLEIPKKLCDYKPAYGYIFEEEIRGYEYWGYCDLDEYYGSLDCILTEDYLFQYDKIFSLGHMTLYKNDDVINKLFMRTDCREGLKYSSYKEVFQETRNLIFDEWPEDSVNINMLAEQAGVRISNDWPMSDILPHRSHFEESFYYSDTHCWSKTKTTKSGLIIWENGKEYYVWYDKGVRKKEIIYAHIQKRKLNMKFFCKDMKNFIIEPDRIISFKECQSDKDLTRRLRRLKLIELIGMAQKKWKIQKYLVLCKHRLNKLYSITFGITNRR